MDSSRLARFITELKGFLAAAWRGIRVFAAALRAGKLRSSAVHTREDAALPVSYGRTRLVVLVVDPYTLHAYWEVPPAASTRTFEWKSKTVDRVQAVLRICDVDGNSFDAEIDLQARNWYIHLWAPGKSYDVKLGLKTTAEGFIPLAEVNRVQTPRAWPNSGVEDHFMRVSGDERRAEIVFLPDRQKSARTKARARVEIRVPTGPSGVRARGSGSGDLGGSVEVVEQDHAVLPRASGRIFSPDEPDTPRRYPDAAGVAERQFVPGISSISIRQSEF